VLSPVKISLFSIIHSDKTRGQHKLHPRRLPCLPRYLDSLGFQFQSFPLFSDFSNDLRIQIAALTPEQHALLRQLMQATPEQFAALPAPVQEQVRMLHAYMAGQR
jgi:hypothetical protein